jgi:hypothetical protein
MGLDATTRRPVWVVGEIIKNWLNVQLGLLNE